jgi:hypothetical protein
METRPCSVRTQGTVTRLRIISNDQVEPICGAEKGADVANQTKVASIDRSGGRERRGLMRQVSEAPVGRPVLICAPADERDTRSADEDDSGELSPLEMVST